MAVIGVTPIPKAGLVFALNFGAVNPGASGDRVPPGSVLLFRNTSGSALTVTINTLDTVDGDLVVADRAQTAIAATTGLGVISIPTIYPYVDPADGLVLVTTSIQALVFFICINT